LLAAQEASPVIVPKGRSSGWFDVRGAAAVPALHYHRNPTVVFEGGLTTVQQCHHALSHTQQHELLGIAHRQGEQLGRLLDQLLAAAAIDRGQGRQARRSLVDAAALTEDAGRAARLAHPDHHIIIAVAGPLLVRVDPLAVTRILGTLLDTAAAYSKAGTTIRLSAGQTAGTRWWPSRIKGRGSHRPIVTGSSNDMRGWTSSRTSTSPDLGLGRTSPGGSRTPTTPASAPPTHRRLGALGSSCACPWRPRPRTPIDLGMSAASTMRHRRQPRRPPRERVA
jgi:hypothetical protein